MNSRTFPRARARARADSEGAFMSKAEKFLVSTFQNQKGDLNMNSDEYLRKKLIEFRERIIFRDKHDDDRNRRRSILRRDMIRWLIKFKPLDEDEWYNLLPEKLFLKTDMKEFWRYARRVIRILNSTRRPVNLRYLKNKYWN